MKALVVVGILMGLSGGLATAQTLQCTANGVACLPGTQGCAQGLPGVTCVEQATAPPTPPACPFGTYWSGSICIQPAPVYTPPPVIYQQPQVYNPYWNTPLNQIPGWGGVHPGGVTPVPGGGFIGPYGHFHPGVH